MSNREQENCGCYKPALRLFGLAVLLVLSACNMLNPPSTTSVTAMHRAACEERIRAFGVAMPKPVIPAP